MTNRTRRQYILYRRGFTFIEVLVVIAVIGIVATISTVSMSEIYRDAGLRVGTEEVRGALREARAGTLGAKDDVVYGVHIATSTVTRFIGQTYVPGHASNTIYTFDAGTYATGTLVSTGGTVVFTRLSGLPSVTGTVLIHDRDAGRTATVTILGTGLVE